MEKRKRRENEEGDAKIKRTTKEKERKMRKEGKRQIKLRVRKNDEEK